MKLKRFFAGAAAAAVAASTLAISANAGCLYVYDKDQLHEGLNITTSGGDWLLQLYNTGNPDENKPAVDYGIKPHDVAKMSLYFEVSELKDDPTPVEDFIVGMDGGFGGGIIFSANGGGLGTQKESDVFDAESGMTYFEKYNWPSSRGSDLQWWGLPGPTDTPDTPNDEKTGTIDYSKGQHMEYISDLRYRMNVEITDDLRWPDDENRMGTCYQIGTQEWGNSAFFTLKVCMLVLYNESDEVLIAFDEFGYQIKNEDVKQRIADFENPPAPETPAETTAAEGTGEAASTGDSTSDSSAPTSSAPTSSAPTSSAPTTTAASGSNSSSNTGLIIAIIAVVVVIVVVVVIILVKKKKS